MNIILKPMENIYQEGSLKLPEVNFNYSEGLMELKGRSTPENTFEVFQPIIDWARDYVQKPQEITTVNIHFEYFNSSSSKYLARFLEQLRILKEKQKKIVINWYYEDEELLESGKDFAEIIDLDFVYIKAR